MHESWDEFEFQPDWTTDCGVMPSLHLAYDELTAIVRCLNFHFRAISVRYRTFFGRRRVVVASTILFNSELYKKFKIVET